MKSLKASIVVLAIVTHSGLVSAQFVGPSGVKATNVAELLKSGTDDQYVELSGHLLRKLGHEKYEFYDGTASVRVEIDDEVFPRDPVSEKTKVQIRGEVEKQFVTSMEIDVKSIRRID